MKDRFLKKVGEQIGVPYEELSLTDELSQYSLDSLDIVQLVMMTEDEFGVTIPDELDFVTFEDIYRFAQESRHR